VLLSAGDQHHWHRVCNALAKPEWLEDPRFITRHDRAANGSVVNDAVNELLANMSVGETIDHFRRHDIVAAPVNTIPQAAEDPHPWERGAMMEVPDFLAGSIAVSGDFWHFSRTPVVVGSTPQVGEHNEEVLSGLLGYSDEQIAQFREDNVIGEFDYYDEIPE
jgi:crotonobetainyl-CoA:carnitine CoA-transferase CaiB-like acyl-CoA transferase